MRQEQQFIDGLYARLDQLRGEAEELVQGSFAQRGNGLQARVEREVTVAERSGELAALNSVESGLCFGRLDFGSAEGGATHHIGRTGIRRDDAERTPLLVDWRAPVARPFYLATGHTPMGLRRRRHLTTRGRTVTALHDEILDLGDTTRTGHEDPSGDAVLLAALNSARTGRMADIVQTIQAEQDRIIRAPHRGVLVVEGGPGTGKTAVALHRAAYLLYAHREQLARRAVLIVGPNPAFLGYIGDVLPSLGETGVLLATTGELFPGVTATGTDTPEAAVVKGRAGMADVLARVVREQQTVPDDGLEIPHEQWTLHLERAIAEDARHQARTTKLPHNLARPHFGRYVLDALTAQLADRIGREPYEAIAEELGEEIPEGNILSAADIEQLGKEIAANPDVTAAIDGLWPELTPQQLVSDFLADPGTRLSAEDAAAVRREDGAWTPADVPLLDEAAALLGQDDHAARAAAVREYEERVAYAQGVLDVSYGSRTYEFEDLDDEESEVLSAHDLIDAERFAERHDEADHRSAAQRAAADRTWAFGHIIVDEAQELSAMAWRLLMRRCPTHSMTLVGDPAQTGDAAGCGSWQEILDPYVGDRYEHTRLGVNYRTPAEIMELAAQVMRASDPSFEPPSSVRSTGVPPWTRQTTAEDLPRAVADAVAQARASVEAGGRLAVVAPAALLPALAEALPQASCGTEPDLTAPVVLLAPHQAKGLEFDTVIVAEPDLIGSGSPRGTGDLYVALTRATQRLGLVHTEPLSFARSVTPA
ncbi:HelD family protein [Streptomyces candidus]|uniref:HelD family protein n=1 Tax=Streptomyces candidus TaxID=67283 RepID=UPI00160E1A8B|nr:UvrD-helicase domain-containing protein [Streptomyces candidus]